MFPQITMRWRGRGSGPGLAVLLGLPFMAACGPDGPGPVAEATLGYEPPTVELHDGVKLVANRGARERLNVFAAPPSKGLQLLFMRSHSATPLPGGGVLWADADGARVLEFDERGTVARVLQGTPVGERPLTQPMFVTARDDEVVAIEPGGAGLLYVADEPTEWLSPPVDGPVMGGARNRWAAARTILEFNLGPIRPSDPLLWVSDEAGDLQPIGQVRQPDGQPFLGHLVNTGWVAADGRGRVYFAAAIRPEISAFTTDGERLWTATWKTPAPVETPSLGIRDGQATPFFAVYQYGLAIGQDGLIYVLGAPDPDVGPDHVFAFDEDGVQVRAGQVRERSAVFLGRKGHVYSIAPEDALARTGEPERAEFPEFDLPELGGEGRLALGEHRGKVVVVNFWASWCGPCRREMPLLRDYALTLDTTQVVVLGLNEDVTPSSGIDFLAEIGGVPYMNGEGRGDLRRRYNYRGLPYTVVLDRELHVIRSFYGFGESIDPIKDVVDGEDRSGTVALAN